MLGHKPRGWGGKSSLFKAGIFVKHLLTPVGSKIETYKYPSRIRNVRKGTCAGFTKATLTALWVPSLDGAQETTLCVDVQGLCPHCHNHHPCAGSSRFEPKLEEPCFTDSMNTSGIAAGRFSLLINVSFSAGWYGISYILSLYFLA